LVAKKEKEKQEYKIKEEKERGGFNP